MIVISLVPFCIEDIGKRKFWDTNNKGLWILQILTTINLITVLILFYMVSISKGKLELIEDIGLDGCSDPLTNRLVVEGDDQLYWYAVTRLRILLFLMLLMIAWEYGLIAQAKSRPLGLRGGRSTSSSSSSSSSSDSSSDRIE